MREFAAESLDAAMEKAAEHFGVSTDQLEVSVLSGRMQISGVGSRVVILATIRDEPRHATVRDEPRQATIRDEPRHATIRDESRHATIRDEPRQGGPTGEFVLGVLDRMGLGDGLEVGEFEEEGEVILRIRGESVRGLLRRDRKAHGALAHLANRAAQKLVHPEVTVRLEVESGGGGEERLEEMARDRAREARSGRREVVLPPMNSRERWIVHNTLKTVSGIRTESVGTGRLKRVKILPD